MTSSSPYTPSLDMTHMYSFVDYRGVIKTADCKTFSIMNYLDENAEFSKFRDMINKTNMHGKFNSCQSNFTLFIVPNTYIKNDIKDIGLANRILNMSTMNNVIDSNLLTSSPSSYYYTLNKEQRLYVTNDYDTHTTNVNLCSKVLFFDIKCSNGMIHVLDNLLVPTDEHYIN